MDVKNVSRFYSHLAGTAALAAGMLFVNSPLMHALTVSETGLPSMETQQNAGTIKGQVVDSKGEAVIGASVRVKGAHAGSVTDLNGNFTLKVNPNAILEVTYVGYQRQEVALNGRTNVKITMQDNSTSLDEVVVVGYGTQKKASLTSAISQIKGDEVFANRPQGNPTVALQGAVPGLVITRTSTRPGSEGASMKIRGDISINGNSTPLVIIDGISGSLDELNEMDANDIENISVLKDGSAAIYGARSAAGVVLVTTKKGKKGKAQVQYSGSFSTTIDGIQPAVTNNREFLDMFYEAQVQDYNVLYPELAGQTGADGHPAVEGAGGFWWLFGKTVLTGTDADGKVWQNRELWEALRDGKELTLNSAGTTVRYEPWHTLKNVLYGQAFSQKHSVSVSGADDRFSYRASLGFSDNNSQLKVADDNEKKYSGRLNVDYKVSDLLKLEAGMSYEKRNIKSPTEGIGQGYMDPWFWPVYNELGQIYDTFGRRNPVGYLHSGYTKTNNTTFRSTLRGIFDLKKITEGLTFTLYGGYKVFQRETQKVRNPLQMYDWVGKEFGTAQFSPGYLNETIQKWENITGGAQANYARTFADVHNVSAMVGMTVEQEMYKNVSAERNKGPMYPGSDLTDLNVWVNGTTNKADGGQNGWSFVSYLARLGYTYKDKYIVEFLARRDGSSKLTPEQRWKNFYDISAGWVLSEESFLKGLEWLNFLKVRYNYGKTGSVDGIGNYESYATLGTGSFYYGQDMSLTGSKVWLNGMTSTLRTWETIEKQDVGFDVTVLNNRLSATFDWFRNTNDGMFIPVTYPAVLGASAPKTNNGKFRSQGWEFSLNWRDRIGQVTYNLGAQISDSHSKVMKLENNENVPNPGINTARLIGKPRTAIYVYKTAGLFQTAEEVTEYYNKYYWNADHTTAKADNILPAPAEKSTNTLRPGARKLVDVDGDGAITQKDLVYKGDTDPHFVFGLKGGLEWKGIDFSFFFQGVAKQNVLRSGYMRAPWVANYTLQNSTFEGKTWTPDNPNAQYAIMSRDQNFNMFNYDNKDISVQQSRYIRLKNLTVGYTLPKAWTQKLTLSKVRIYFSGEDLWEATSIKDGFDPEFGESSNNTFPFSRLLSFGLDVTF